MRKIYFLILIFVVGASKQSYSQFTKLHDFNIPPDGYNPAASLFYDGTFLYGMTQFGGTHNWGTVFKIKPDGSGYIKLYDFDGYAYGGFPLGALISDGTYLYGMTKQGGITNGGIIFKIMPDGTGFTKLMEFSDTVNGAGPAGSFLYDGTYLYGMTGIGGAHHVGTIFKIKTDGSGYARLHDFDSTAAGRVPWGSLITDGTWLYGMAELGGVNDFGTVFKIMPDGSNYTNLFDFDGAVTGKYPYASLTYDGTYLYGVTRYGGTNNLGTIFRIKPDGSNYLKLLDFTGVATGGSTLSTLVFDGTFLYGLTEHGGTNNDGTIYKIKSDGSGFAKLLDFNSTVTGSQGNGSLITDGNFLYGMTDNGGVNSEGVVFKYGLAIGIDELSPSNKITPYPNPFSDKLIIKGATTITLFNLTGKEILRTKTNAEETTMNTEGLAAGMYFLRVEDASTGSATGRGVANYKVVKTN